MHCHEEEAQSPPQKPQTWCNITAEPSVARGCETIKSSKNRKSYLSYLNEKH